MNNYLKYKRVVWNCFTKTKRRCKAKNETKHDGDGDHHNQISNENMHASTRCYNDYNLMSWTNLTLFDEYLEMG